MDERVYARYMADVAYFITRLEQNPNSKYFMPIALAYNKMEKYNESISVCKAAIERFPSYCPVKTLLAEAYIFKGEIAAAKPLLLDVITEDSENYKALKLLGIVHKAYDETGEALKYFKAAYIRAPEDGDLRLFIEELGGSVITENLFDERMKKSQDSLWSSADEESNIDIAKQIRGAEIMMSDLVSDVKIAKNLLSTEDIALPSDIKTLNADEVSRLLTKSYAADESDKEEEPQIHELENTSTNTVDDNEISKLLAEAYAAGDAAQEEPKTQSSDNTDTPDAVSDEELNKLFATAQTTQNTKDEETQDDNALEEEIEASNDYSVLENILENSSNEDIVEIDTISATSVLSAIGGDQEEETSFAGVEMKDSDTDSRPEDFTPISSKDNFKEENRITETVAEAFRGSISKDDDIAKQSSVAEESIENDEEEFFVLDESVLDEEQMSKKEREALLERKQSEEKAIHDAQEAEKLVEEPVDNFSEEISQADVIEIDGKEEIEQPIIGIERDNRDIPIDNDDAVVELNMDGPQQKQEVAETLVAPIEYRLEDMIGDDSEDIMAEEDLPAQELGESAPFTQRDILDEILSVSPSDNEDESIQKNDFFTDKETETQNNDKTMKKLLKLQERLEKLKKAKK